MAASFVFSCPGRHLFCSGATKLGGLQSRSGMPLAMQSCNEHYGFMDRHGQNISRVWKKWWLAVLFWLDCAVWNAFLIRKYREWQEPNVPHELHDEFGQYFHYCAQALRRSRNQTKIEAQPKQRQHKTLHLHA